MMNMKAYLIVWVLCVSQAAKLAAVDVVNPLPRVKVVQGDVATLGAQFGGGSGAKPAFAVQDVSNGQTIGRVDQDASGSLQWVFDSSDAMPDQQQVVELVTMAEGSVSDRKRFVVEVVRATPRQQWLQEFFGDSKEVAEAADGEDPDMDGRTNLEEFAFGLNPKSGTDAHSVSLERAAESGDGQSVRAVFRRRKDHEALGIAYQIEFSSDLTDWTVSEDSPALLGEDGMIEQVGLAFPVLSNGRQARFFRVKVQQNSAYPNA
jgi:hypothetical protein